MRQNHRKTARNTAIAVILLLLLIVGGATVYVYFTGKDTANNQAKKVSSAPEFTVPKHVAPAANVPESAALESILSPVSAGSNTSVNVRTLPDSKCTIVVTYQDVKSKDSGLAPKVADYLGFVSWTWTVEKTAPVGSAKATVTCVHGKKSAVVVGNIQVKK